LAVAFVAGIVLIRWLLTGSHGVIAVARALVEEAAGARLPAVIVLLVVLGLPILPLLLDPAERLEYRMQFLLDWSLSGGSFLLAMLSIALACSTLCGDIDSQRIHMTLVKPIERWQYLLGKWIGIVLLNALLVVLVGIGVYAAATTLRQSPAVDAADRLAVNEQVLTARIAARPEHPRRTDFDQAVEAAVEQIRESEPDLFARDPAGARNRVKSWEVLRWHTVTASKVGTGRPAAPAASRAAAWAAARASWPAQACTVISSAPRRVALRQAPAMVAGMSWNLRSRNTRLPCSRSCRTTAGPPATNSSNPTFTQRSAGIAAAKARA
jgi:hypothetical protein